MNASQGTIVTLGASLQPNPLGNIGVMFDDLALSCGTVKDDVPVFCYLFVTLPTAEVRPCHSFGELCTSDEIVKAILIFLENRKYRIRRTLVVTVCRHVGSLVESMMTHLLLCYRSSNPICSKLVCLW